MSEKAGATEKELIKVRKEKLKKLRNMGVNPYPSHSDKDYSNERIVEIHEELIASSQDIVVAGRVMAQRGHGKLVFVDVVDETGKLQLVLKEDSLADDMEIVDLLDIGDFIEATGPVILTRSGEVSVEVKSLRVLTKAIRPLPSKQGKLTDEELRLRKRYLDMLMNPEVKDLFYKKARFWSTTRNFLLDKGFLEVETPVIETTVGGADAEPFKTFHKALGIDAYLRISMGELWQKRLLVGGFEKTFEIGRQFRNEGISREHLQDYTQMEFYWAYASYEEAMQLCEEMYKNIAEEVFGTTKFKVHNLEFDLSNKWERIEYVKIIEERLSINVLDASDEEIEAKVKELSLEHKKTDSRGRMIDALWKSIRGGIAGPAFLIHPPVEVSPLAKRTENDPRIVERFQIILGGSENGNGYSELNDPIDQRERFEEQARMREEGDLEAQMHDEDFVEALEYGMPPAAGFGFSERLFSFLAGKPIRECVIFPLMRPLDSGK